MKIGEEGKGRRYKKRQVSYTISLSRKFEGVKKNQLNPIKPIAKQQLLIGGRFPGSTIPPFRHKFMLDSAFRRKFLANSDSAICSVNDAILMHFTSFKLHYSANFTCGLLAGLFHLLFLLFSVSRLKNVLNHIPFKALDSGFRFKYCPYSATATYSWFRIPL